MTEFSDTRASAEADNATAQVDLGFVYANGEDVPQDDAEAVRWFRKAADQGDADGKVNLGCMYQEGRGVPQDDTLVRQQNVPTSS